MNSEPTDPQTPKRKRPVKMSPELAAKKKQLERERLKEKKNEPCDCGGTSATHRILYELSEGPLIRHLCVGSKAATKAIAGREVHTKEEYNKIRKQLNAMALESEGIKQCECGKTAEDHKYLVDMNDTSFKIKCMGSVHEMELKTAERILVKEIDWQTVKEAIERKETYNFRSGYEGNENEMGENQTGDGEKDKTEADTNKVKQPEIAIIQMEVSNAGNGENTLPNEKSEYQEIQNKIGKSRRRKEKRKKLKGKKSKK
ncbi:hypothetical protein JTB14_019778 [Gonioctena quinquepunctata]|nr:hypothetical protein JTB14_019778 [Gonioctena quinquepunctata]